MRVAGGDYRCAGCGMIGGGWSGSRRGIRTFVNLDSNKFNALKRKMGWMPLSPSGSAMCQTCVAEAQVKGEGIHVEGYHHRR